MLWIKIQKYIDGIEAPKNGRQDIMKIKQDADKPLAHDDEQVFI